MISLTEYAKHQIPRLLTQLDRDPDSPTFGCLDRNYWHYKIRDFPSAILQQSCVALLYLDKVSQVSKPTANVWLTGAIKYWILLREKNGGLEEYYPFEQSYPATAFSLQAITYCLLQTQDLAKMDGLEEQVNRTTQFLLQTPELKALNQQAAGIAALAQVRKLGYSVHKTHYSKLVDDFFTAQSSEGWFPEYGGPDLGYLSVTIDMLWDYFEASQDERALTAINKAVQFIELFVTNQNTLISVANSRETDYLVPYGIRQFAQQSQIAQSVYRSIFGQVDDTHFLWSVDDRYASHYILNSVVKSLQLPAVKKPAATLIKHNSLLPTSGIFVERSKLRHLVVAGRKGGSLQIVTSKDTQVDYGWRCLLNNQVWVSNIWNDELVVKFKKDQLQITGHLVKAQWASPSVIMHMGLRFISYTLGRTIIQWLKKRLIFLQPDQTFEYKRVIDLKTLEIADTVVSTDTSFRVKPGIKQPIRHVASAFQYSPLDSIGIRSTELIADNLFTTTQKL